MKQNDATGIYDITSNTTFQDIDSKSIRIVPIRNDDCWNIATYGSGICIRVYPTSLWFIIKDDDTINTYIIWASLNSPTDKISAKSTIYKINLTNP